MKILAGVLVMLTVAACAPQPHKTMMELDTGDPKFRSAECLDIRNRALTYDDKIGERAAIGLVGGLLLGPFALPIAAAADASQNTQREAFNRELELRCKSAPAAAKQKVQQSRRSALTDPSAA